MALKPSLVNLPVLTATANTLDLPSYLGYINATPTANATYKLPVLKSYSEGAWTQIKNQSAYTITINDNDNNNIGVISAGGVGEYVSSAVGWIDYSVNAVGVITGDTNITGYLNVGSAGPPVNTNSGDITGVRLSIGTPQYPLEIPNLISPGVASGQIANIVHTYGPLTSPSIALSSVVLGSIFSPAASSSAGIASVRILCNITPTDPTANLTNTIFGVLSQTLCDSAGGSYSNITGIASSVRVSTVGPSTLNTSIALRVTGFQTDTASAFIGNVTTVNGLYAQALSCGQTTAATINTANGINVVASSISGTTTLTTHNGILIASQNILATDSTGLRIDGISGGTNNRAIWIRNNTSGTGAGICFGTTGDTSLWRGAVGQLLTTTDWMSRHYLCSSVPTVAAGAGAGTSPTISITGTDHGFTVTLTTGTTATINATLFTVTFGATWTSSAPAITWAPGNTATSLLYGTSGKVPFTSAVSTTSMTFTSSTTALSDTTTYIFRFTAMR